MMNFITYHYKLFQKIYPKEIWIYTLLILLHMSRKTIFNVQQDVGNESVGGGTLLMLLCTILNYYYAFKESKSLTPAIQATKSYFVFYIFALLSFLWAIFPDYKALFSKCLELISSYMLVSVIMWKTKSRRKAMLYLLYLCTLSATIGYFAKVLAFKSILVHTNTHSLIAAMGALTAWKMKNHYKIRHLAPLVYWNFFMLLMGTSSASNIAFIVGLFVMLSCTKKGVNIPKLAVTFLFFSAFYYFFKDLVFEYVFYGKSQEAVESGTGRQIIWNVVFDTWRKHPWFGLGYIVGERHLVDLTGLPAAYSTHNGFLSVLLGTGIAGAIIFGWFYLKTIWINIQGTFSSKYGTEMTILLPMLAVVTVNNLSFPAVGSEWNYTLPPILGLFALIHTIQYKTK